MNGMMIETIIANTQFEVIGLLLACGLFGRYLKGGFRWASFFAAIVGALLSYWAAKRQADAARDAANNMQPPQRLPQPVPIQETTKTNTKVDPNPLARQHLLWTTQGAQNAIGDVQHMLGLLGGPR